MAACAVRQDLHGDIRPTGNLQQVPELAAYHVQSANRPVQYSLVQQDV
jgi:hypothetical protein